MLDQRSRSLKILARVQAIVSALIALIIFAIYGLAPSSLQDTSVSLTAAILGVVGVVYFLTIHQVLARKRQALSTLIFTVITACNVILVIASTGGLDSPFYSLWLLAIVVAGIFGTNEIIGLLGLTLVYFIYELVTQGNNTPYFKDHLIELGITVVAGALAEWVQSRNRKATLTSTKLESMTGQLSAEQLKADAIVQGIGEGVMVIDATRKIQLFNLAAQQLTGWDEDSARNIDYNLVLQLKTAKDQALVDANEPFLAAWKEGKTLVRDDVAMTTRAGRKILLSLSISPIYGANKQPSGAIALFRDISKEKEVERQKDEFVSTASHEMRTPVAAIEGYISLAMNPNVATIDERAKKYLDKAHEAIGHLGELFRDLLSVTKADAGKLDLKIEAVNIAKLLQTAAEDMQFVAGKKNLTLVYQIGDTNGKAIAPLFYVAANPERLREVVMNLIDNAIKFTTEGGVKLTLAGNDKEVTVGVTDTGIGIAQEDIPHLFQKFYRIDSSATRTIGGTGLGLYLCRSVIEAFNGRIWIESKIGQGSTFKFNLPRMTQEEVAKMQAATSNATTPEQAAAANSPDAPAATPPAQPAPAPQPPPPPVPAGPAPQPIPVTVPSEFPVTVPSE